MSFQSDIYIPVSYMHQLLQSATSYTNTSFRINKVIQSSKSFLNTKCRLDRCIDALDIIIPIYVWVVVDK